MLRESLRETSPDRIEFMEIVSLNREIAADLISSLLVPSRIKSIKSIKSDLASIAINCQTSQSRDGTTLMEISSDVTSFMLHFLFKSPYGVLYWEIVIDL